MHDTPSVLNHSVPIYEAIRRRMGVLRRKIVLLRFIKLSASSFCVRMCISLPQEKLAFRVYAGEQLEKLYYYSIDFVQFPIRAACLVMPSETPSGKPIVVIIPAA